MRIYVKFIDSYFANIFQYFEQDDPELYKTKIKFIAENDVDDMELTFAEEVYADGRLEKVNKMVKTSCCYKKCINCNFKQLMKILPAFEIPKKMAVEYLIICSIPVLMIVV